MFDKVTATKHWMQQLRRSMACGGGCFLEDSDGGKMIVGGFWHAWGCRSIATRSRTMNENRPVGNRLWPTVFRSLTVRKVLSALEYVSFVSELLVVLSQCLSEVVGGKLRKSCSIVWCSTADVSYLIVTVTAFSILWRSQTVWRKALLPLTLWNV